MSRSKIVAAVLACAGLVACAQPRPDPGAAATWDAAKDKLSADDVKALLATNHREDGVDSQGHVWSADVTADGKIGMSSGSYTDSGTVKLKDGKSCVTYAKLWGGQERCFVFARLAPDTLASYGPDGALMSTFKVVKQ